MKVFLVVRRYRHEIERIVGAYSTRERAEEKAGELAALEQTKKLRPRGRVPRAVATYEYEVQAMDILGSGP